MPSAISLICFPTHMTTSGFATRKHKLLITMIKMALAVTLLAYLIMQAQCEAAFTRLIHEPKQWTLLAAGLICSLVSTTLSFLRWHVLVRALNLPFRLTEAIRLGRQGLCSTLYRLARSAAIFSKQSFSRMGNLDGVRKRLPLWWPIDSWDF